MDGSSSRKTQVGSGAGTGTSISSGAAGVPQRVHAIQNSRYKLTRRVVDALHGGNRTNYHRKVTAPKVAEVKARADKLMRLLAIRTPEQKNKQYVDALEGVLTENENAMRVLRGVYKELVDRGLCTVTETQATEQVKIQRCAKACASAQARAANVCKSLLQKRHNYFPLMISLPGLGNATTSYKRARLDLSHSSPEHFSREVDVKKAAELLTPILDKLHAAGNSIRKGGKRIQITCENPGAPEQPQLHWGELANNGPAGATGRAALERLCADGTDKLALRINVLETLGLVVLVGLPRVPGANASVAASAPPPSLTVANVITLSPKEVQTMSPMGASAHVVFQFITSLAKQAASVYTQEEVALGMGSSPGWALQQLLRWAMKYHNLYVEPCSHCRTVLALDPKWKTLVPPVVRPLVGDTSGQRGSASGSRNAPNSQKITACHIHCYNMIPAKFVSYERSQ